MNQSVKNHDHYINGQWPSSDSYQANISPSNLDDNIGNYAMGNSDTLNEAVDYATLAAVEWRHSSGQVRADLLEAMGAAILSKQQPLAELLAREEGKPLAEAMGEVGRAAQVFKFFAGEALRITGDAIDSIRPGIDIEVSREAIGVVGLITPWNFPIAIPAWKMAPALAFGNTVILKPSELTPGCAIALAETAHEVGFPAGVLNVVNGDGAVGGALVNHPNINAISFTGSVNTGKKIRVACAERGVRVQCEMGGKNPWLVMEDADLDTAVNCALNSAFFSSGQRCTASSRLIVCEEIHDQFVTQLVEKLSQLKIGDALTSGTQMGPLASLEQINKSQRYIDIAVKEGAHLAFGGERLDQVDGKKGYYLTPALLTECNNQMQHCREEIFGPVASVIKVKDFAEGLAVANDTEFGLAAGIATQSLKYARDFRKYSQAGMVMVNLPTAGVDYHVPFGGTKGSSYGQREQGRYAIDFYTNLKTQYIFAG